jgi:hypothetical protein
MPLKRSKFRAVSDIIINIFNCCARGRRKHVELGLSFGLPTTKTKNMPTTVSITNEQKIKATLTPVTDTGKPAKLDGAPSWAVISGNSQVVVADDGLSADLVSSDDPGDTEILIKADADLGEGVEEISDTIKLTVIGATAKNLGISLGSPQPK